MRRVALLYNPAAGIRRNARVRELERVAAMFDQQAVKLHLLQVAPQVGPAELLAPFAGELDAVIACGGDGTVNEVLQAIMQGACPPALGIIPSGSGNLLAKELGLPRNVERSARIILGGKRKALPVATIELTGNGALQRFWLGAAGVGIDARVISRLHRRYKATFGIAAYYLETARQLLLTEISLHPFEVEWREGDITRRERVTQIAIERIGYFGRCLEGKTCDLQHNELRALLFKTERRRDYMSYGVRFLTHRVTGSSGAVRHIEVVRAAEFRCHPIAESSKHVLAEVDGELLGGLPLRISLSGRHLEVFVP